MRRSVFAAIAFLLACLAPAALALGQTSVTLRLGTAAPAGEDITLGLVAEVSGPEAASLSSIVVAPAENAARAAAASGRVEITLPQVRAAMQKANVNWGAIALRGSSCSVRVVTPAADPAATPSPTPRRDPAAAPGTPNLTAAAIPDGPNVRTAAVARLAVLLGVAEADLRVTFRDEDAPFLATSTLNRRVDVQPTASTGSSRIPLRVYVYEGDRVVAWRTVSTQTFLRREVLVASALLERRQTVSPEMYTLATQWLEPGSKRPATPEEAAGSIVRLRVAPGEVIFADALELPLIGRRGDRVYVHCLAGAMSVRVPARLQQDGREGDLVTLRLEGSGRGTITARLDGPGRAVMVLDEPVSPALTAAGR